MRVGFATVLSALLTAVAAHAASPEDPSGLWSNDKSMLRISRMENTLRAEIVALLEPTYKQGESRVWPAGEHKRDENNPDETMRGRLVMGINLFKDFKFEKGKWRGQLYDPESGNWYSAHVTVTDEGLLRMRGYIGAPMFGRTAEFVPAESCTEPTIAMAAQQNGLVDC